MVGVLGVLRAQRCDGRAAFRPVGLAIRFEQLRPTAEPDPREAGPVLVPAVDQKTDLGPGNDVPYPGKPMRFGDPLGLCVERRVDDTPGDSCRFPGDT